MVALYRLLSGKGVALIGTVARIRMSPAVAGSRPAVAGWDCEPAIACPATAVVVAVASCSNLRDGPFLFLT